MAEAVAARAPDLGHALAVKLVAEARRLRIDRRRGFPALATCAVDVELGAEVGGVGAVGSGQVEVVAQVLGGALSADCEHEDGVVAALERLRQVLVDRSLGRESDDSASDSYSSFQGIYRGVAVPAAERARATSR